jgi:septum formation protein
MRLILASASTGRRELLERAGYSFEVIPSDVEEPDGTGVTDPRRHVAELAWMKAAAVAKRVDRGLILAADSVGWLNGKVIGKPADERDAWGILEQLAGTGHELWSGVCLWHRPSDWQLCWQEVSLVQMKRLSHAELTAYIQSYAWLGKSGAYAIQEQNDPFIHVARGTISNVVGLPMESLAAALDVLRRAGLYE